jgi:hypothetical protein
MTGAGRSVKGGLSD